jgi:pimeloyl-ACP methyl ester carboxylesterase
MSVKRPDLFYAYIGHSQLVNPSENTIYDYHKVYRMAQSANDKQSIGVLDSIGAPPYDLAKNTGRLLRIIKKYERENSMPAPALWFKLSPGYDNEKDSKHREDGDDYSFVNFAGDKRLGIKPMSSTINLLKDAFDFKIPVYLIQGEEDILTSKEITKEYFNKIKAPKKEFILLPNTAHGFNLPVVEMHYKIMKEYILPFIK